MRTLADMRNIERRQQRVEEFLRDRFGFNPDPAPDPQIEQQKEDLAALVAGRRLSGADREALRIQFAEIPEDELREILDKARG
jgi:hypothetical protein